MTKQEVKTLIEGDEQLMWWAGLLFAEICGLIHEDEQCEYGAEALWPLVKGKVREFQCQVTQRMVEVAEGKVADKEAVAARLEQLEARVSALEKGY